MNQRLTDVDLVSDNLLSDPFGGPMGDIAEKPAFGFDPVAVGRAIRGRECIKKDLESRRIVECECSLHEMRKWMIAM